MPSLGSARRTMNEDLNMTSAQSITTSQHLVPVGVPRDLYTSGAYLQKNTLWHADESPWKAEYVLRILKRNGIVPRTICDVGCGAGEVLRLVQKGMKADCTLWGYEI